MLDPSASNASILTVQVACDSAASDGQGRRF